MNPTGKGYVHIDLIIKNNQLRFQVKNSVFSTRDTFRKHSGVGLENVRKRFHLLYPDRHNLEITKEKDVFTILLTINFKETL